MFHKSQKTRGPDGLRPQGHRKSRADLKNNNFAPKNKWVTIWGGGSRGGGPEHFLDRHGTLHPPRIFIARRLQGDALTPFARVTLS